VLAIAAARLGWEPVTAVERVAGALETISVNAAANHVAVTTRWLDLTVTPAPWAPVVVANLPGAVLRSVMIERPPELMIASGFLTREAGGVAGVFGMRERERRTQGEWAAVVLA
jgi:ribosomal protein L11 methylase PrmA